MAEIVIVRQPGATVSDEDKATARRVVFGAIDGLGEQGRKQWRRFWNGMLNLEPGEMVSIVTHKARVGTYHRRQMLLETRVFEAQERIASFDDFRLWLKLGAGHVTWMAGVRGGVVPVPKSIAYDKMEQTDFEAFHQAAVDFLRSEHAITYLWPKLTVLQRHDAIEAVLGEFGVFGL